MRISFSRLFVLALFFILGISITPICYASGRVVVKGIQKVNSFIKPDITYVIKGIVDLGGKETQIPQSCTIKFKRNGKLVNGVLKGTVTKLKNPRIGCIGVVMKGTWHIPIIKDVFFDSQLLSDNQIFDNISQMQSDDVNNRVQLTKSKYRIVLDKKHKVGLSLKSNTELINGSIIAIAGNDLPQYTIISVARNNVIISGGEIVGDVGSHQYIEGTTSQWGFGISINKATNVTVSDIKLSKCTGDGIYIGGGKGKFVGDCSEASKNIVIKDVVSDDNRRQGISITYADGVRVENCTFSNTGKTESVSPGCGMDIEPNEGQSVKNVTVKNCRFLNNNKVLDVSIGGYQTEGDKCNVESVLFENCFVTGSLSIRTGSVVLRDCEMATLNIHLAKMPKEKVLIERCKIHNGSGVTIRSVGRTTDSENMPVYVFKSCTLDMNQVLTRGMFSKINHKGNEVAEFQVENCNITMPGGTQKYDVVQDNNTCSFRFSNCEINARGRNVILKDRRFSNCKVSITE